MRQGWPFATVALIALALLASCGDSADESPVPAGADSATATATSEMDFQERLLADGLTFEEYEEAFLAYAACAEESGWQFPQEPRLTSRQNYDFIFYRPGGSASASPEEQQEWLADLKKCENTYFSEVQRTWANQTAMTGSERQAARDALGACLREHGRETPEHPSESDWEYYIVISSAATLEERMDFRDCIAKVREEFGLLSGDVP